MMVMTIIIIGLGDRGIYNCCCHDHREVWLRSDTDFKCPAPTTNSEETVNISL